MADLRNPLNYPPNRDAILSIPYGSLVAAMDFDETVTHTQILVRAYRDLGLISKSAEPEYSKILDFITNIGFPLDKANYPGWDERSNTCYAEYERLFKLAVSPQTSPDDSAMCWRIIMALISPQVTQETAAIAQKWNDDQSLNLLVTGQPITAEAMYQLGCLAARFYGDPECPTTPLPGEETEDYASGHILNPYARVAKHMLLKLGVQPVFITASPREFVEGFVDEEIHRPLGMDCDFGHRPHGSFIRVVGTNVEYAKPDRLFLSQNTLAMDKEAKIEAIGHILAERKSHLVLAAGDKMFASHYKRLANELDAQLLPGQWHAHELIKAVQQNVQQQAVVENALDIIRKTLNLLQVKEMTEALAAALVEQGGRTSSDAFAVVADALVKINPNHRAQDVKSLPYLHSDGRFNEWARFVAGLTEALEQPGANATDIDFWHELGASRALPRERANRFYTIMESLAEKAAPLDHRKLRTAALAQQLLPSGLDMA